MIVTQELAEELAWLVDQVLRQHMGATPQFFTEKYGTVFALEPNYKVSISTRGLTTPDEGYAYPAWMDMAVGDYVRVVDSTRGDRYVDQNFTRRLIRRGEQAGELVFPVIVPAATATLPVTLPIPRTDASYTPALVLVSATPLPVDISVDLLGPTGFSVYVKNNDIIDRTPVIRWLVVPW